jgi:hypothetical protein
VRRYNKYPDDVRVRRDLVERVLGQQEHPLDQLTMVQLLHQVGDGYGDGYELHG